MRLLFVALISLCPGLASLSAQETFSIVAVDTVTGTVGSAGASCLDDRDVQGGATIISDVLPGRGAIHTQALYRPANQRRARERVQEGLSADSVIRWLRANDARLSAEKRQYGLALLTDQGAPQTAAFTGSGTDSFKDHYTGSTYAIQGNILKGPEVLDSMRSAFLRTGGSLATRLMAALQGANMPGADRRCLAEGVSSQSAFLRIGKPGDTRDDLSLDLAVTQTPTGVEPIDSLQVLFDKARAASVLPKKPSQYVQVGQQLGQPGVTVQVGSSLSDLQPLRFRVTSLKGRVVYQQALKPGLQRLNWDSGPKALYFYQIRHNQSKVIKAGTLLHFSD